jgi:hypothetical protein
MGFCPLGPDCPDYHLKSLLNPKDIQLSVIANFPPELNWCEGNSEKPLPTAPTFKNYGGYQETKIICHRCGVEGHKSTYCQEEKLGDLHLNEILARNPGNPINTLSVTCFSCYQKGHYANACPNKTLMKHGQMKPDSSLTIFDNLMMTSDPMKAVMPQEEAMN